VSGPNLGRQGGQTLEGRLPVNPPGEHFALGPMQEPNSTAAEGPSANVVDHVAEAGPQPAPIAGDFVQHTKDATVSVRPESSPTQQMRQARTARRLSSVVSPIGSLRGPEVDPGVDSGTHAQDSSVALPEQNLKNDNAGSPRDGKETGDHQRGTPPANSVNELQSGTSAEGLEAAAAATSVPEGPPSPLPVYSDTESSTGVDSLPSHDSDAQDEDEDEDEAEAADEFGIDVVTGLDIVRSGMRSSSASPSAAAGVGGGRGRGGRNEAAGMDEDLESPFSRFDGGWDGARTGTPVSLSSLRRASIAVGARDTHRDTGAAASGTGMSMGLDEAWIGVSTGAHDEMEAEPSAGTPPPLRGIGIGMSPTGMGSGSRSRSVTARAGRSGRRGSMLERRAAAMSGGRRDSRALLGQRGLLAPSGAAELQMT